MEIIVLSISVLCYFFANIAQNKFSSSLKGYVYPMNYFQMLWMGIACVAYIIYQFSIAPFSFSVFTISLGAIGGLMSLLGGIALLMALSKGPLSLTILIFSMYIVIPPMLAIPFLGETLSFFQIVGLLLIIAVLIITNYNSEDSKQEKSKTWWILSTLSSLFSGLSQFMMKYHQTYMPELEKNEYIISGYVSGVLISVVVAQIFRERDLQLNDNIKFKFEARTFLLPALGVAATQGIASFCNLYNASRLPAVVLYPVSQLATLMLTVLFSIFALKEKPTKATMIGLLCGVVAIVCMNF